MLAGLRHRAVCSRNNQNGAVHLGRTGNHVFDIVGVTGAVYVGIVTSLGFVFNVGRIDL